MGHINTMEGGVDMTASAFIVRLDLDEPKLLLHKHKKLRTYMQVGGHKDPTEDVWDAVLHEIVEESGYSLDQLSVLQPRDRLLRLSSARLLPVPLVMNSHKFDQTSGHTHCDVTYLFAAIDEPRNQPLEGESTSLRLFSGAELSQLPESDILDNVRQIGHYALDTCKQWVRVELSMYH